MDFSVGFREVIPDQTIPPKWAEFTLNTGGTQSTLQDFKIAERKGGYSYRDQKKFYTRNRFIYWRVHNDVVELQEESLDVSLTGNCVRYTFADTPVLDGITVCEVPGAVLVLVPTVCSVHRLSFPHPDLIHGREHSYPRGGTEYTAPSIFAEASQSDARNPISFHVINNVYSNVPPPHTSASGLSPDGEDCLFALAYASGSILLVRLNAITGAVGVTELSEHSDALMPRFLSRALRGKNNDDAVAVSLAMHTVDDDTILLALCRDGNARAWSTTLHTCSIITNFPVNSSQGAQNHVIKKSVGPDNGLVLGILHCFVSHSIIHVLQAVPGPAVQLKIMVSMAIPGGKDVADFAVTGSGEVWVVLRSAGGKASLAVWRSSDWQKCELEVPWSQVEIPMDPDLDAKQIYMDFLFHPGRFSVSVINKALSIYHKAPIIASSVVPIQVLKERVCAIVDSEVRVQLRDREHTADELSQMQLSCWRKFCACVVEYHESRSSPLGLLPLCHRVSSNTAAETSGLYRSTSEDLCKDEDDDQEDEEEEEGEIVTSGLILIKKSDISLIRPMDAIESIVYYPRLIELKHNVSPDLVKLLFIVSYLDDNVPEDSKISFDKGLRQLQSPIRIVAETFAQELSFCEDDTEGSMDVIGNVAINIESIKNLEDTITSLLNIMDVGQADLDDVESLERSRWLLNLGHLYSSQLGMSLVATSLAQIIQLRYNMCRCLLIFEHMAQTKTFQQFIPNPVKISSQLMDRTAHLTQCYFLLHWIAETPVQSVMQLENVETSVSILKLKEDRNSLLLSRRSGSSNIVTILHLFLQGSASATVRLILSRREIPLQILPVWQHSFLPFLHVLTQLVWPISSNSVFPEFLLFSGQRMLVIEYTRLLSKWCHNNSYTRKFVAACALMDMGEHVKAFDLFNKAAHGVPIDDFLRRRVVRSADSEERLLVLYYVQVMKLFEQQGLHDLVVELAQTAISSAKPDEPELPTLHSVTFLHRLELGEYSAAYDAMLANPDAERRRHCLQQLIVTLVDAGKLPVLMKFKYDGVRPELERTVEARARSMDVLDNPYYDFLYAYLVERGSLRKAGCVMYEQALRLSTETSSRALTQRGYCLEDAINCLSLVKPEDAWIVKPAFSADEVMETGEMNDRENERLVEVLELKDLQKEVALCQARLKLSTLDPEHIPHTTPSPQELVAVLSNAGLYKDALHICNLFGLRKAGVLSSLAGACVRLDETPNDAAWDWLRENDAEELGYGNASTLAWRLLEVLLSQEEDGRGSSLHKDVTTKLLHLGVFLPYFLVASYKKRNAAELLRLLLAAGRLEEASELSLEYIEAVLGKGKERFGLDTALLPQHPAVWLPLNSFDLLLHELQIHSSQDASLAEWQKKLRCTMDKYLTTVMSVSQDKVRLLQEEMIRMRAV